MVNSLSMKTLFKKLSTVGLSESYVRKVGLPSWWSDELNNQPTAVLEGAGHIAQRLHVDLASLLKEEQGIQFKPLPRTKFKYHLQRLSDVPSLSHQLASRIAELVSAGIQQPFIPISHEIDKVRAEVIQHHSSKVTLESLLDYCWQHGIAVAYFNDYPENTRKITGMVQWQNERPVILLSHKRRHSAWLAFHLAHELGHLALGHVTDGILIDDEISQSSNDNEETAANIFAVRLLVNRFDNCFSASSFRNGNQLRKQILNKLKIDPTVDACVLAFNYSWHTGHYGLASRAVEKMDCGEDGALTINQFLENHLAWDSLSDDNTDHLERVLGE